MEFIDDHDIEVIRREQAQICFAQALHRRKDVLPISRSLPADPQLAEAPISKRIAVRVDALLQDLSPVGNKEEPRPWQALTQTCVIHGRHDCLAGAGGRNQQIAMSTSFSSDFDLFQQSFLERLKPQLDRR